MFIRNFSPAGQRVGIIPSPLPEADSGKGATTILSDGINSAKMLAAPSSPDFNIAALDLIYDRRTSYVKKNVAEKDGLPGLLNRYRLERKDARDMLNR